jgi:hypothetical protein
LFPNNYLIVVESVESLNFLESNYFEGKVMDEKVLVTITVSRNKGKIAYKVDCSKDVKSEELAYYLDEIMEGICAWKPEVCKETIQSMTGIIVEKKENK